MGLDEDLLLELIGRCYEAALDPVRWPELLERLSDAFGGAPVHFGLQRLPGGMPWRASARRDPEYHRRFQERFAPPRASPVVAATAAMRVAALYPRHGFIDEAAWRKSELYHEIVRPQGQEDFAQAILVRAKGYVVPFTIYRRGGAGPFTEVERRFLDRLLPHLGRCLQVQLRLETAAVEAAGLAATLDRLPLAVLLLDGDGGVVRVNAAAESLLRARDGLWVRDGRVVAASRRETERLRRLIAAATATGDGRGADPGGTLALSRPAHGAPLSALVSPLPAGAMRDHGLAAAAVLLVREPGCVAAPSAAHLRELYGLTATEARVAAALLEATSAREAAVRLGLGVATLRTHLHRIFAKTGTTGQAELVRLLTTCASLQG